MSHRRLALVGNKAMTTPVAGKTGVFIYSNNYNSNSIISSGMRMSGVTAVAGGVMRVFKRGVISGCTDTSGYITVLNGGKAYNTTVCSGGLFITSGGYANGAMAYNPVTLAVSSGGLMENITMSRTTGNTVAMTRGGVINNLYNTQSGMVYVTMSGGTISNLLTCHGSIDVSSGYMYNVTYSRISSNVCCVMNVSSGGLIDTIRAYDYGTIDIRGGTVINATLLGDSVSWKYVNFNVSGGAVINASGVGRITAVSQSSIVSNVNVQVGSVFIEKGSGFDLRTAGKMFCGKSAYISKATISSGGICSVYSAGVVERPTISSGGSMIVSSGCSALNVISKTGAKITSNTGAYITYMLGRVEYTSNGTLISDDPTLSNITISSGGVVTVFEGGVTSNITVISSGMVYVSEGGLASQTTVNSNGHLYASNGGVASNTTINSGGLLKISDGGSVSGVTVSSGRMYISSGGIASNTTITSDGSMTVSSGGSALNVVSMTGATITSNTGAVIIYAT